MKKIVLVLAVGLVLLGIVVHRSGSEEATAYEECYGPAMGNGPYANKVGKPCTFVVECPPTYTATREVSGVILSEHRDVLVLESQGVAFVLHKRLIVSPPETAK